MSGLTRRKMRRERLEQCRPLPGPAPPRHRTDWSPAFQYRDGVCYDGWRAGVVSLYRLLALSQSSGPGE